MIRVALTTRTLDAATLTAEVASAGSGATNVFIGTVRNTNAGRAVSGIEYSAYGPMAERELAAIAGEAERRAPGGNVVIEHRIGALAVGEASVVIAVSHAHRREALDATAFAIEELKRRVPIWKCERYDDGTREWVHASSSAAPVPGVPSAGGRAEESIVASIGGDR